MADMKVIIGADIQELERKLAIAKAKLSELGQTGPRALAPLQERLKGLTFPVDKVDKFKDAFKSLATNLIGPAVGLAAVGVAIAGASKWLKIVAKDFITTSNAAEIAGQKIKSYSDAIDSAVKSVAKENTEVIGLIGVLKSETETRERKLWAIKELQKIQPEIFADLKLEGETVLGLDDAYKSYLGNLNNVINAKILQAQLDEKIARQLKLQNAIVPEISSGLKQLSDAEFEAAKNAKALADNSQLLFLGITQKQGKAELRQLTDDIDLLGKKLHVLSKAIKVPVVTVKPKKIKIEKPELIEIDFVSSYVPALKTPDRKKTAEPTIVIKPKFEIEITDEQRNKVLKGLESIIQKDKLEKFQADVSAAIGQTFSNIINDSISTFAEGIADVISGQENALPNLFGGLIKGIGGQIKELGKYMVQVGLEMLVIKEALEKLKINPYLVILAGVALQILGATLMAAATKKAAGVGQGFASGVRSFSGGSALVGERGPERIFLPAGSSVQPNNELNAFGGGGGVTLMPSIYYEGTGFRIMLNRVEAQMSRNS